MSPLAQYCAQTGCDLYPSAALTGIFPERYDADGMTSGIYGTLYNMHLLGVMLSTLLLLGLPFVWYAPCFICIAPS